jgi:hypothetical protein
VVVAIVLLTLLHGTVHIGPTTPVCRSGVRCDKPAARVRLTFTRGAIQVHTTTDRLGRYTVRLESGTWTVRASVGMRITPGTFTVPHAASARRDFSIDTGIR